MLARTDWLEADEWNLHGHDKTKEVEGCVGDINPIGGEERDGMGVRGYR